ncbi:MAG: hypothetical protein M3O15_07620 [Acidobacteriota bacterium]|nr:hypothetical protein [Acidobacteriota bacterium]
MYVRWLNGDLYQIRQDARQAVERDFSAADMKRQAATFKTLRPGEALVSVGYDRYVVANKLDKAGPPRR